MGGILVAGTVAPERVDPTRNAEWSALPSGLLVPIASIVKPDGTTKLVDIEPIGDNGNRLYLATAGSGGRRARIGTRGADDHVDLQVEPKGQGRLTEWGDPAVRTIHPMRRVTHTYGTASFDSHGIPGVVFDSPGSAPVLLEDSDGGYTQGFTTTSIGSIAGLKTLAAATRPRLMCGFTAVFRASLAGSQTIVGLFNSDVSGTASTDITVNGSNQYVTAGAIDWTQFFTNGDTIEVLGMPNAANDGVKTVTGVTSTLLTVSQTLTSDATALTNAATFRKLNSGFGFWYDHLHAGATDWFAMTQTSTGYTRTQITGASAAGNSKTALRAFYAGDGVFVFAWYNFSLKTWGAWQTISTNVPGEATQMGPRARIMSLSGTKNIGVETFDLNGE